MRFHRETLAGYVMFARCMKMELYQFVDAIPAGQLTAFRHIDLNGVAVIHHFANGLVPTDGDTRYISLDRVGDING